MTYLFRYLPDKNSQDDLHSLKDHGWRTYVPGLAYQHIVTTFVVPMRQRVVESPRWDVRAILGTHGFPPWSLEEFHDVIGSQYESMLKNGDPNPALKAVVTTQLSPPGIGGLVGTMCLSITDIPSLTFPTW
jgi:hypothetical protein